MDQQELITSSRPPLFKSAFESGAIITAILIVYTMILYLINMHTVQWLGYVAVGIMIVAIYIAGVKYRDAGGRTSFSYGSAFKFLALTLVVASILGGIFNYIYFIWIAPEVIDVAIETSYEEMLGRGLSESQADQQMEFVLPWMTPEFFALIGAFMSIFWGLIACLVMAAMLKRETTSI